MREERKKEKTNIMMSKLPIAFMAVFLLAAVLMIVLFFLPHFRVESVMVVGCHSIEEKDIVQASGIKTGTHLFENISGNISSFFLFRYGNLEEDLKEKFPFIESVSVQANFPSAVEIKIKERQKIGYIKTSDGYAVIDKNGYVVALSDGMPENGAPLFSGVTVLSAVLGQKVEIEDSYQLDACLAILNAILLADQNHAESETYFLMKAVCEIRYINENMSFIRFCDASDKKTLIVRLGKLDAVEEEMRWLDLAIRRDAFETMQDQGILDMSGENYTFKKM